MLKKRHKPDLMITLALIFALGLTFSSFSQSESRPPLTQAEILASGVLMNQAQ